MVNSLVLNEAFLNYAKEHWALSGVQCGNPHCEEQRKDYKKAYVSLKEGYDINFATTE